MREAEGELRARVAALVQAAKEVLGEAPEAVLRRISDTLRAAATGDDELREALRTGTLESEPDPSSGFDVAAMGKLPARRKPKPPKENLRERRRRETLQKKAEQLRAKAKKLAEKAEEQARLAREAEAALR
jgi:hypothetical protein